MGAFFYSASALVLLSVLGVVLLWRSVKDDITMETFQIEATVVGVQDNGLCHEKGVLMNATPIVPTEPTTSAGRCMDAQCHDMSEDPEKHYVERSNRASLWNCLKR